jgi:hypothetical protein
LRKGAYRRHIGGSEFFGMSAPPLDHRNYDV